MRYCECDVTVTRDGFLVLNHDDNVQRLTLDPEAEIAQQPLSHLNLRDVLATPLASGVRPPLLREVLESAAVLGPAAQLVIEIKPSSLPVHYAVAKFLAE